jgi:uncharacterized protein (TIGR02594 family)
MTFTVKVTADKLHIRQGAGRTFDSLITVANGDTLSVLGIDPTGTWLQVKQAGRAGKEGWCSARYLLPQGSQTSPWLEVAVKEIGIKEYPGAANNHPRIQAYLATVNGLSAIDKSKDETYWCSCFMNWCVEQMQINGTDSAWAKSWGNWRESITPKSAQTGDIAVFDRSSATSGGGHVGIFIDADPATGEVLVLGGNQSDAVRYAWYPADAIREGTHYKLLSCRRIG